MRRGIFINILILVILVVGILLPLFVFAITEAIAKANGCEISNLGWGEGICKDMYALAFLAGLVGSFSSPFFILILALYLMGVTIYFVVALVRSKSAGQTVPGFARGMFLSTIGIAGAVLIALGVFLVTRWYQTSFISACKSLPDRASFAVQENGRLAVGVKLPYPEGRPEQYIIEVLSMDSEAGFTIKALPASKSPAWSPSGDQLIFSAQSDTGSQWGLFLSNNSGQISDPVFEDALEMQSPDWAPDGKSIIFHRWVEDNPNPITEIFSILSDGGNLDQLTDGENYNGNARFSPDGDQIVFVSDRNGASDIYVMDSGGGEARRLTYHNQDDIDPAWSPDGNYIVFSSSRGSSLTRKNYNLYVMAPDGTNQCQITSDEGIEWRPVWSADGAWIAYIAGLEDQIYMLHPDGTEKKPVQLPEQAAPLSLDWGNKP